MRTAFPPSLTYIAGAVVCVMRAALGALILGAAIGASAHAQPPPPIIRWEILATVIQIDEPEGILTEVHLGDPVRGSLSFHLAVVPDGGFYTSYTHPATFPVTRMIIENPRTGGEIEFVPATDYSAYHNVDVYEDYFIAIDDVLAPPGLDVDYPLTAVEFEGLPGVLPDFSLPQEIQLEDWPIAILSFNDVLGGAAVYAEIYSLTPVEVTYAASDFDFDGDVDADDLQVWTESFGTDGYLDADADFDYDADGADFLAWQRQFGPIPTVTAANGVPEPRGVVLLALALAGGVLSCKRR